MFISIYADRCSTNFRFYWRKLIFLLGNIAFGQGEVDNMPQLEHRHIYLLHPKKKNLYFQKIINFFKMIFLGACNTYGGEERWGNAREKVHLEDPGIDERRLRWFLKKWNGAVWTG
jgi:hypothetical protein